MSDKNDTKPVVSVIIPALNEIHLQRTIENVLENAELPIEIIAILDGYWPEPPINDHPSVRLLHNTEPRGQRHSINDACKFARGKFMMKLDGHCAVGPGFDRILARDCEYDMTMVPRMYNLDIDTFKPKKHKRTDYMFLGYIDGSLRSLYYERKHGKQRQPKNDIMIDEIMTCMGPGWFMHMDRFWELGGCDERHGHWGQQGAEVACKAWLSGGRLMVNKHTWFAHWFRGSYEHKEGPGSGRKGFPYSIRQTQINRARKHSNRMWIDGEWEQRVPERDLWWLIKKFNAQTWEGFNMEYPTIESRGELFVEMYKHIHRGKRDTSWRGVQMLKFPNDIILYQEVIHETKPEVIVEIGTKFGGSALFFQDVLDLMGDGGKVVTIDKLDQVTTKDPRIEYIVSDSLDKKLIADLKKRFAGKRVMLVIDGNHNRRHVKWELHHYHDMVPTGMYIVVEDCYIEKNGKLKKYGPCEAKEWFLDNRRGFEEVDRAERYLVGVTMGGWIKRK